MELNEKLNIDDMEKTAENFHKSLKFALRVENKDARVLEYDPEDYEFEYSYSRSAMIQIFEITVECAWKIMQRWVKINNDKFIIEKPKRELFRIARECGLIDDSAKWWTFYEARNTTSHAYNEEKAEEVYKLAKEFDRYLSQFMMRLEERA